MPDTVSMEARRQALVEEIHSRGVTLAPQVAAAFRAAPRHLFLPGVFPEIIYRDIEVVTRRDKYGLPVVRSTQPSVMARMLTMADLQPGHNVLEIGTGTGFDAAILAEIVGKTGRVTTIEIDPETAEAARSHLERAGYTDVMVVEADGTPGYAANAPYDRILATSSAWDIPAAWPAQLKPDGMLVIGLCFGGIQLGAALRRQPDSSLRSSALFPLALLGLRGEAAGPDRHTIVPGSALHIDFVENPSVDEAGIHTLFSEDHAINQLPLELQRRNLGQFSYYLLFHQPPGFAVVTYRVEEGQLAFGLERLGWGIISRTSACMVPYGDERGVHTYGSADAFLTMADLASEWAAAGQPDLDDYELHVTPAGQRPFLPPTEQGLSRIFVRPGYTYTLWRKPGPGA